MNWTRRWIALVAIAVTLLLTACSIASAPEPEATPEQPAAPEVVILDEEAPPEPQPTTIDLVMVGDILLHDHINDVARSGDGYDYSFLFAHVSDEIAAADVAIVNQETPLGGPERGYYTRNVPMAEVAEDATDEERRAVPMMPVFNSPDAIADAEAAVGFDVVLKAHNHSFDAGYAGLAHELAYWTQHYPQIAVIGVADPYGESGATNYVENVYVFEKEGFRVAILNYSSGTNLWGGDMDGAVISFISEEKILADVARAREAGADMIVACPHWGTEYLDTYSDGQAYWAQFMADAGVDVIFGTHPHVIEPVRVLTGSGGNTCVCFYSNGNFTTANTTAKNMITGLSCVTLQKTPEGACSIVSASFLPAVVHGSDMTTYLLRDYTDELAASNWQPALTRDFVCGHCSAVLGDGFDPATGVYTVALPA